MKIAPIAVYKPIRYYKTENNSISFKKNTDNNCSYGFDFNIPKDVINAWHLPVDEKYYKDGITGSKMNFGFYQPNGFTGEKIEKYNGSLVRKTIYYQGAVTNVFEYDNNRQRQMILDGRSKIRYINYRFANYSFNLQRSEIKGVNDDVSTQLYIETPDGSSVSLNAQVKPKYNAGIYSLRSINKKTGLTNCTLVFIKDNKNSIDSLTSAQKEALKSSMNQFRDLILSKDFKSHFGFNKEYNLILDEAIKYLNK